MISYLRGELVQSLPHQITLDIAGVGYQVFIPLSSYDALPQTGSRLTVLTHLQIREDAHILYGFLTADERDLFRLLIQRVSGVGPKIALAILGGMPVDQFKAAVVRGDFQSISRIKGLGKKTAERVVLELKDKVGVAEAWHQAAQPSSSEALFNDALLALINLGYTQVEAHKVIGELRRSPDITQDTSPDEIIRAALRLLN